MTSSSRYARAANQRQSRNRKTSVRRKPSGRRPRRWRRRRRQSTVSGVATPSSCGRAECVRVDRSADREPACKRPKTDRPVRRPCVAENTAHRREAESIASRRGRAPPPPPPRQSATGGRGGRRPPPTPEKHHDTEPSADASLPPSLRARIGPPAEPRVPDDVAPFAKFIKSCAGDVRSMSQWMNAERGQTAYDDATASLGAAMKLSVVLQCEAAAATGDPVVEYVTPFERVDYAAWRDDPADGAHKVKSEVGKWLRDGPFVMREDMFRGDAPGAVPSAAVMSKWWTSDSHCLVAVFSAKKAAAMSSPSPAGDADRLEPMIRSVWSRPDEGATASLTALGYASVNFPEWPTYLKLAAAEAPRVDASRFKAASGARTLDKEAFGRCVRATAERLMATALRGERAFRALIVPPEDLGRSDDDGVTPVLLGNSLELQKVIESSPVLGTVLQPIDVNSVFPRAGLYVYFR